MNISDDAVEALARVLADEALFDADMAGSGWDAETDSSDHFLPRARVRAKAYLEAAAPRLMAAAWDEGHDAGFTLGAFQGRVKESPNPYRSPGAGDDIPLELADDEPPARKVRKRSAGAGE